MPRLTYSTDAKQDIRETVAYISRDNPAAAHRWLTETRRRCRLLARNPKLGEIRKGFDTEELRVFSHGNYVILYAVVPGKIQVARIVRGDRDIQLD